MSGTQPTGGGFAGAAWSQTGANEYASIDFLVRQIIAGKAFSALVKVLSVTEGGIGSPPIVSVQNCVNQVDGFGNQTPRGEIYNIPCFRLQGGTSAVIVDPVVGDTGHAIICDRDISTVKATRAISGPGSARQHDWSDGCYFGSFLGATPTQYVHLSAAGIEMVSPTKISMGVDGMGVVITAAGTVIDGKPFLPHEHFNGNMGANTGGVV